MAPAPLRGRAAPHRAGGRAVHRDRRQAAQLLSGLRPEADGAADRRPAAGLPMEEAWRAITINPAQSLGISDRVGSLEPGKDADLVLWTADPLTTIGGEAYMTIVNGEIVYQAER